MFLSFLKITLRNLYHEKMYALINISGLSIAIACCLILGLWLRSELTYDRYNVNYRQIFRIVNYGPNGNEIRVPSALCPLLAGDCPEIIDFVRFAQYDFKGMNDVVIRHGDDAFRWGGIRIADDNVFNVFTFDIIYGDPESALADPGSMAVSESFSRKYFGAADPVGETMTLDDQSYKITLVFGDLPENTSLKYDVLLSFRKNQPTAQTRGYDKLAHSQVYLQTDVEAYLLMQEGYGAQDFKPISNAAIYERYGIDHLYRMNPEYFFFLQPLADIHLDFDVPGENTGNKFYIYGFTVVAGFILLVACINYMNLATARAAKRAKEVGIRKILGAGKGMLRRQFLGEAIFFSLIALVFALAILEIALNLTPINSLLNNHLEPGFILKPGLLLWMLGFSLVVGLLSGAYPAFYLSAMPVSSALTKYRAGKGTLRFRQALVMIQLTITVCIIACTLLMALQMQFVSREPLGFEKENRIAITLYGQELTAKIPTLKNELLKNSHIFGIAQLCGEEFGNSPGITYGISDNGDNSFGMTVKSDGALSEIMYCQIVVDNSFIRVMGIEMASGRDFSAELKTDLEGAIIVNETMVEKMGWDQPLGQFVIFYEVIGVVKDFKFDSLHSPVTPLALSSLNAEIPPPFVQLILHISKESVSETIAFIEGKFEEFDPEHVFRYEFLDDILDANYLSEYRIIKLIGSFGGICIFISCLGLFGLSAFTTEQRTKEIGIRKVLGASTWQIIRMLFRNILFLVLGGAILASLVAYFVMDEWLISFAYRTGINPIVFFLSAVLAAGVSFITVALQSYKTARANPVIALRYE